MRAAYMYDLAHGALAPTCTSTDRTIHHNILNPPSPPLSSNNATQQGWYPASQSTKHRCNQLNPGSSHLLGPHTPDSRGNQKGSAVQPAQLRWQRSPQTENKTQPQSLGPTTHTGSVQSVVSHWTQGLSLKAVGLASKAPRPPSLGLATHTRIQSPTVSHWSWLSTSSAALASKAPAPQGSRKCTGTPTGEACNCQALLCAAGSLRQQGQADRQPVCDRQARDKGE